MQYEVSVTQVHSYLIEASSFEEAKEKGLDEFVRDMRKPVAHTDYNDVEVQGVDV